MKRAVVDELTKHGADNTQNTVDPNIIQESLGAAPAQFAPVLSELTDFELVGIIAGQLYLRRKET